MTSAVSELSDWPEPAPRIGSWDPFDDTWGDEAVDLCHVAGLELDEWQEISLRIWLGTRPGNPDRWAHRRNGMIVPRQNGKGAVLEARQLVGLFLFDWERLIIHTAHQFNTAQESFARLVSLVEDSPLRHRLASNGVTTANGKEAIKLRDGSRVKFMARSPKSGRGFTSDLLIYDEAMVLDPAIVGASGPSQSARPNPQTIYTATAGDASSTVLAQVRDQGIAGTPRLSYVEYAAGGPDNHTGDDIDLDERDEWLASNPAMWGPNPRMTLEAVEEDRRMMDEENFARERLCLWWVGKRVAVIDPDVWAGLVGKSTPNADSVAFAVDMPPERDRASIAVASDLGGRRHWELIARRPGTSWVVDELARLDEKWKPSWVAVDPSSPAGSLIDDITAALTDRGVAVLPVRGSDLKAACGQFIDRVNDGPDAVVVHDMHTAVLASAVDALRQRNYPEGGFTFLRRDTSSDISPVMAMALANHALGKPPKKKRKSGRASFQ